MTLTTGFAAVLDEEIDWRSCLTPEMTRKYGYTFGTFITGTIWTIWRLPILILLTSRWQQDSERM